MDRGTGRWYLRISVDGEGNNMRVIQQVFIEHLFYAGPYVTLIST